MIGPGGVPAELGGVGGGPGGEGPGVGCCGVCCHIGITGYKYTSCRHNLVRLSGEI